MPIAQQSIKLIIALLVTMPACILIPLVGWIHDWPGVIALIVLSLIPTYFAGLWIARQEISVDVWLWTLLAATFPLLFAAFSFVENISDPLGRGYLLLAAGSAMAMFISSRKSTLQNANQPKQ